MTPSVCDSRKAQRATNIDFVSHITMLYKYSFVEYHHIHLLTRLIKAYHNESINVLIY
jgi:hypothetical protein